MMSSERKRLFFICHVCCGLVPQISSESKRRNGYVGRQPPPPAMRSSSHVQKLLEKRSNNLVNSNISILVAILPLCNLLDSFEPKCFCSCEFFFKCASKHLYKLVSNSFLLLLILDNGRKQQLAFVSTCKGIGWVFVFLHLLWNTA